MKKIILLSLLTINTIFIYGQDYYPLVEENKKWSTLSVLFLPGEPMFDTSYTTWTHFISGDSIINNIAYKKLYTSEKEFPDDWALWGFIREENKKVWLRRTVDNEEALLYDFNVNVGDSLIIYFDIYSYYYIDSITTVFINNEPRKKYWISYQEYDWHQTWIEGIGSNRGVLSSGSAGVVGGWFWGLCTWEDEELIYSNPSFNACYLTVTGIEEIDNLPVRIYPNPAKDLIIIENPENIRIETITLFDISGQMIKHFDPLTTRLDISGINPGIYLLKISDGSGVVAKKIVIE